MATGRRALGVELARRKRRAEQGDRDAAACDATRTVLNGQPGRLLGDRQPTPRTVQIQRRRPLEPRRGIGHGHAHVEVHDGNAAGCTVTACAEGPLSPSETARGPCRGAHGTLAARSSDRERNGRVHCGHASPISQTNVSGTRTPQDGQRTRTCLMPRPRQVRRRMTESGVSASCGLHFASRASDPQRPERVVSTSRSGGLRPTVMQRRSTHG